MNYVKIKNVASIKGDSIKEAKKINCGLVENIHKSHSLQRPVVRKLKQLSKCNTQTQSMETMGKSCKTMHYQGQYVRTIHMRGDAQHHQPSQDGASTAWRHLCKNNAAKYCLIVSFSIF